MPVARHHTLPARRGLSLVELMIGIVVGLFVVAAATMLVSNQLGENRRLLLETQLQQDLRATADIVTRELRRTGARFSSWKGIADANTPAEANPFNAVAFGKGAIGSGSDISFSYDRLTSIDKPHPIQTWQFLLQNGVIRTRVDTTTALQDLTDANVVVVDTFQVTWQPLESVRIPCPKLCPDGSDACWPTQTVHEFVVDITAHARADSNVKRSIRSRVRQRNDKIDFNVPGLPDQACPT